ncbi:MAG TPA: ribosome small subunit-dependent GTPase A [Anaerolineales bacterium]
MHSDFNNPSSSILQGTVYKKALGSYVVHRQGQLVTCSISNKLRKELVFPIADPNSIRPHVVAVEDIHVVDPVAIGDEVQFVGAGERLGMITRVLPRRNQLTRRDPGKKRLEQVIVANVDQVVPVFAAAQPEPKWNLLDRYLATAEWAEIPVLICITKADLERGSLLQMEIEYYRQLGYRVIETSVVSGQGIAEMQAALQGRLSVFVGKSGVGKTSLLNAIQPDLGLRVNTISQSTGKGRHTTSHLEMFPLETGGGVVDTPGMREFSLGDLDGDELALLFPELRPLVGRCRFGLGCDHTHEPGCAIRQAVQAGKVSSRRYQSYLKMREGD